MLSTIRRTLRAPPLFFRTLATVNAPSQAASRARGEAPIKPRLAREKSTPEGDHATLDGALIDRVVDVTVKDIDGYDVAPFWIQSDDSLNVCAKEMYLRRIGVLLVQGKDGAVEGIISERDCVKALAKGPDAVEDSRVIDYLTPVENLVCITAATGLGTAMDLMREHAIRHLPLVKSADFKYKNDFIGVISIKDILVIMTEHHMKPVLSWMKEEDDKHMIHERAGYSE